MSPPTLIGRIRLASSELSRSFFSFKTAVLSPLHTMWLFTCDQTLDVMVPCSVFAICGALSGERLGLSHVQTLHILRRSPYVAGWLWLMVLQCCLHNQRHPQSVEEDKINKPWRPIPAGRVTASQTERLLMFSYVVFALAGHQLGVLPIWIIFTIAVIGYNDCGGGETNFIIRNAINSIGYGCFLSSSLQIAIGGDTLMTRHAGQWVFVMMLVIFTTIHAQDFRDEPGDSARGRSTIITAIGHTPARISLIVGIAFWSIFIPMWMGAGWVASCIPWILGAAVARMTAAGCKKGDVALDSKMYKLWGVWMLSLTTMPLAHALGC